MSKSYIAAKRCTLILSLICYVIILVYPFALAQDVTDQAKHWQGSAISFESCCKDCFPFR